MKKFPRIFEGLTKIELFTLKAALDLSGDAFIEQAEKAMRHSKFWLELICRRGSLLAEVTDELDRRI